jgi:hypothetical protein
MSGYPEECIKWLMGYRGLEVMMLFKETAEKTKIIRTLMNGRTLAQFDHHPNKRVCSKDMELLVSESLELVVRDLRLDYISRRTIWIKRYYIMICLFMGPNTTVQQLVEC